MNVPLKMCLEGLQAEKGCGGKGRPAVLGPLKLVFMGFLRGFSSFFIFKEVLNSPMCNK